MNLLSNGIKYSSKGLTGRQGEVILFVNWDDVKGLNLHIKDNCIGMSDDLKDKLFTPFSQGESSTTQQVGGTGLGLVITKDLIDLMGGNDFG